MPVSPPLMLKEFSYKDYQQSDQFDHFESNTPVSHNLREFFDSSTPKNAEEIKLDHSLEYFEKLHIEH